jgi:hypothetical protein
MKWWKPPATCDVFQLSPIRFRWALKMSNAKLFESIHLHLTWAISSRALENPQPASEVQHDRKRVFNWRWIWAGESTNSGATYHLWGHSAMGSSSALAVSALCVVACICSLQTTVMGKHIHIRISCNYTQWCSVHQYLLSVIQSCSWWSGTKLEKMFTFHKFGFQPESIPHQGPLFWLQSSFLSK